MTRCANQSSRWTSNGCCPCRCAHRRALPARPGQQAGPALGYGRYADAIVKTASGAYAAPDPAMRREILSLRDDPAANAAMAGAFTQQNAALLTQKIGRPPSEGELYLAHFLGAGGAGQLINLASHNPNAPAGPILMPEYRDALGEQAAAKNKEATELFDEGTHARETADNYVRVTVGLATILFLVAMSQRFHSQRIRVMLVVMAFALLTLPLWRILTLPRA